MERPRRVHFGRGLGQPELERDRIRRAARAGPALGPRGELVDGALGDADERSGQIPPGQTSERRAIAEPPVELPAGHLLGTAPVRVHDPVRRYERVLDHDVLAAAPAHARREPRVEDLVVRARQQEPAHSVGPRTGNGHHDPGGRVAAAREPPPPRHLEPAARRLDLAAGRVQAAREQRVRTGREELLLTSLGKMTEPPVVRRPERVTPGGRSAAATELEAGLEGRVDLDVVAAETARVADADQARGPEILDAFRKDLSQILGARRALLEDGNEIGGSTKQLFPRQGRRGDPGGRGFSWAHGAPMLRPVGIRRRAPSPWPGTASAAPRAGRQRRSGRKSRERRPGAR